MKRLLLVLSIVLASASSTFAQKTPVPFALQQYLNNNGDPYDASGMCIYAAGTSTAAATYTTATGAVTNANPLMMSSAGRPSSNGFFLTPGQSYKLVFVDYTGIAVPSCGPINGSTVWTQDAIEAVPGSTAVVDVADATAGESIAAGDAVFLSNGACSLNAGQWYRTDSDLTCKSTYVSMIGIAPSAITSGAMGSVRIYGPVTLTGPLNVGSAYYAGATQGAIVTTPPTNAIRIGAAQSATNLIVGYTKAPVSPRGPPCGRLTLTSGLPVTTSDVTAATTIYYTPAGSCNTIALYDGTAWSDYAFAQVSIAVPATTSKMTDVFLYDSSGVLTLELTAWTNDTTRATALVLQDGVYEKTGALTRRYLGSFRTTTVSGQTEDSLAKRYVFNYYNRQPRPMRVVDTTDTWTYSTAAYQQANANAANQLDFIVGVEEAQVDAVVQHLFSNNNVGISASASIGLDSVTTSATNVLRTYIRNPGAGDRMPLVATWRGFSGIGRHVLVWLEYSEAVATTTWYGDQGNTVTQTGITGTVWQ